MNRLVTILVFSTFGLPIAAAQTTSDATLQALLSEVKQLRLALERSAVVVPQVHLTLQRLQIQQESVTRTSRELEEVRNELAKSAAAVGEFAREGAMLEAMAKKETDPTRRSTMEEQAKQMKEMKGDYQKDSQLRIRENELASRLRTEQAKLDDLSARLNTLDRMLELSPAK